MYIDQLLKTYNASKNSYEHVGSYISNYTADLGGNVSLKDESDYNAELANVLALEVSAGVPMFELDKVVDKTLEFEEIEKNKVITELVGSVTALENLQATAGHEGCLEKVKDVLKAVDDIKENGMASKYMTKSKVESLSIPEGKE